jgi:hypothetical protein
MYNKYLHNFASKHILYNKDLQLRQEYQWGHYPYLDREQRQGGKWSLSETTLKGPCRCVDMGTTNRKKQPKNQWGQYHIKLSIIASAIISLPLFTASNNLHSA